MKRVKQEKRWTRDKAAECIGVDLNTLYRWESGKASPLRYNVQKLCEVYGKVAEALDLEGHEDDNTLENSGGGQTMDQLRRQLMSELDPLSWTVQMGG